MGTIDRWRVTRRGAPVFSFIDPDISPDPFLVDRVALSALGALIDALSGMGGSSADATLYVTDPFGRVFDLASFDSSYSEEVWVAEAKRRAVDGGAAAVAAHGHGRRFRAHYADGRAPG